MIYNYLIEKFNNGEPIFLSEIPSKSKAYTRLEMKNLVDKGKLERFYNGVYYLPYKTIFGTKGKVSFGRFIEKKYLLNNDKSIGYIAGLRLANMYGFTSQNSSGYDIYSNKASTKQRTLNIDKRRVNIYKPYVKVNKKNVKILEFLELICIVYKYAEINNEEVKKKIRTYIKINKIDFEEVKKYISYFPDIVYKNLFKLGLMNELV